VGQVREPDGPPDPGPPAEDGFPEEPAPQREEPAGEDLADLLPQVPVRRRRRGRGLVEASEKRRTVYSPEQRLLILDTWRRSGLPAKSFAPLVGVSHHTLYKWKKLFESEGPSGLMDRPRGAPQGSRLPEITKRTILMLKASHPDYGCQRISDLLARGPALPASPSSVAKVLHEAGYVTEDIHRRPHPDKVRRFERAKPNQLWQTDLFTFVLKRQNRRVHLAAFLDDHSRFLVGFGLHATASSAMVLETFRAAISSYQAPEEVLTDNGSQYVTWRGRSAFRKECDKRGVKQIVATPRRPQTLGKIERFWGTLWRECLETAIFLDLEDARKRIGFFIDHYNFQRCHQGIDGLAPADRYFGVGSEALKTRKARIEANALELARNGVPRKPFYLTGQLGDKVFSLHGEGDRIYLREGQGQREEVELVGDEDASADTDASDTESNAGKAVDEAQEPESEVTP